MHSVRTALSRGQVGRGREGLTHRPPSSTSARRVGHQVGFYGNGDDGGDH